ncbi:hypothetical protein Tco_0932290, partial [Tanacetum coccineum]
ERAVFSRNPDAIFRDKLKNVKEGLRSWSKQRFGSIIDIDIDFFKDEAIKWESIAETRNLEEFELEAWKEARKSWLEKDRCKSDMLKQKSRVKWIQCWNLTIKLTINSYEYAADIDLV